MLGVSSFSRGKLGWGFEGLGSFGPVSFFSLDPLLHVSQLD